MAISALQGLGSARCAVSGLESLSIVPTDFWHRHYLVYDANFHKLGNCDFIRGLWFFNSVADEDSFMGFSRDDAIRSWLATLNN